MTKSYSESSSQTTEVDPHNHLKNYQSNEGESCSSLDNNDTTDTTQQHEINDNNTQHQHYINDNNNLDNDASSTSSSSTTSVDQEMELQKRLNPTSAKDIKVLQQEILLWRKREERVCTITARNEEHRAKMKRTLLVKEQHLLRKIEQLKNVAIDKHKKQHMENVLELMCEGKQWEIEDGSIIHVETPETLKAREMKDMYTELNEKVDNGKQRCLCMFCLLPTCSPNHTSLTSLAVQKRIQVLEKIKILVDQQQHNCGLAKDISALIDRELQMLYKGTDLGADLINALRRRLSNQFTKLVTRQSPASNSTSANQHSKDKFQLHKPDVMDSDLS